jgi:hypothetical protein
MEKQHHQSVHQKAKSSKMLFGHRNRHNCVVHALSHGRIRVLVKEHHKHVIPLVPLSIVFVHTKTMKKKNFGWGSFRFCESLSLTYLTDGP